MLQRLARFEVKCIVTQRGYFFTLHFTNAMYINMITAQLKKGVTIKILITQSISANNF